MFASIRQSTMFAISCAIMAAMMSAAGPEARAGGLPNSAGAEIVLYDVGTTDIISFSTSSVLHPLNFLPAGSGIYTASISQQVGNFLFTALVESTNTPGGNPALLSLTNTSIANNNMVSSGTDSLNFTVSATGYTIPPTPVTMTNSITGLSSLGTGSSAMSSYVDGSNALAAVNSTGQAVFTSPQPNGALPNSGISIVTGTSHSSNVGPTGTINYLPGPDFSMTISGTASLTAGAQATVDWTADVYGTPAPSSALLAVAGMPVLGLAWMVRRRRSNVDEAAPAIA